MKTKRTSQKESLARSITRNASKQSYYTARLLVDKPLEEDCYRAYGYFRWADDVIDQECQTRQERLAFIQSQIDLVEQLCRGQRPEGLMPEEEIIADLIDHEPGDACKLRSYIRNFLAILMFDAERKGRFITQKELTWYSERLGVAVTDAIQHFIGNGHPYLEDEVRFLAANAAHITHMLRDYVEDIKEGYFNVPSDYLEQNNIQPDDIESAAFKAWVEQRVDLARDYFEQGKLYLDKLDVLRCKLAGHWYCLRFEGVLKTIEKDGYTLRPNYDTRNKISTWIKFLGLGIAVTFRHAFRNMERCPWPTNPQIKYRPANQ
jgi:phytoene/squalene synthetase